MIATTRLKDHYSGIRLGLGSGCECPLAHAISRNTKYSITGHVMYTIITVMRIQIRSWFCLYILILNGVSRSLHELHLLPNCWSCIFPFQSVPVKSLRTTPVANIFIKFPIWVLDCAWSPAAGVIFLRWVAERHSECPDVPKFFHGEVPDGVGLGFIAKWCLALRGGLSEKTPEACFLAIVHVLKEEYILLIASPRLRAHEVRGEKAARLEIIQSYQRWTMWVDNTLP